METSDEAKRAPLDRLAHALGVPVERFFADTAPAGTAPSAEECLRLWSEIATEEGRQQALKALQVIAELERIR